MLSRIWFFCDPMDCGPPGSFCSWDFSDKNTGVGCHFLLQGIFPTQSSNPRLLHCRWVLYHWATQKAPFQCQATINPLFVSIMFPQFWTFNINGIIQYVVLCDWHLSLGLMFIRFIPVSELHFFLLPNNIPWYGSTAFCLFILSVDGRLGYFCFLAIMNGVPWTPMYMFLCVHMFSFLLGIFLGVKLLDLMVKR